MQHTIVLIAYIGIGSTMVKHGVLLPTRGAVIQSDTPSTLSAKTKTDVVGLSQMAEALDFDSVWVGDSVLAKPRHEPMTTLASIAAATEAVQLGTAVYLPPLRDPVNVAHLTATVDQLSGGRLLLGIGTGSTGNLGSDVKHEFDEMEIPWDQRGDILDEQLDVISSLWSGEAIQYDGEFYSYDGASIGFQPCRRPPIYSGSAIHPTKGVLKSIRERVAANCDGWLPAKASADAYAHGLDQMRTAYSDVGRDPDQLDTLYYQDLLIADTEEEALAKEREFIKTYYPGKDPSDEELKQRGIFGPPEMIKEHLEEYKKAGVEHFVTRFPAENQQAQLRRFADLID